MRFLRILLSAHADRHFSYSVDGWNRNASQRGLGYDSSEHKQLNIIEAINSPAQALQRYEMVEWMAPSTR
jgi:hypothetical protein